MVALHNRRLTAKDIWPDNLWTEAEWLKKWNEIEAEVVAEGFTHPQSYFETSKRIAAYQREKRPRHSDSPHLSAMAAAQRVMREIYPGKTVRHTQLTDEELEYLVDKLFGVNDPFGQELRQKLERMI